MKSRVKSLLVGLGFTFGLQVLISFAFTAFAFSAARSGTNVPQGMPSVLAFGFTLGAFLVGGLVVGWVNERLRVGDGLLVAVLSLILTVATFAMLPAGNKGQFVAGLWLSDPSGDFALSGQTGLFVLLALTASAVGSYIGWHFTVPGEGVFDRAVLLIGLVGAIVGPFVLLAMGGRDRNRPEQAGLPWYFLVIVLILVLVIMGVGFLMFARDSTEADDISISPDHHKGAS
jgi:MFS family permease